MKDKRLPVAPIHQDITVHSSPRIDIITAGFPCQGFSQAGKHQGLDHQGSGLISHVFRLVKRLTPKVVFLDMVDFFVHGQQHLINITHPYISYMYLYKMIYVYILVLCLFLKEIRDGNWVIVSGEPVLVGGLPGKKRRYRSEQELLEDMFQIKGRGTIHLHTNASMVFRHTLS